MLCFLTKKNENDTIYSMTAKFCVHNGFADISA